MGVGRDWAHCWLRDPCPVAAAAQAARRLTPAAEVAASEDGGCQLCHFGAGSVSQTVEATLDVSDQVKSRRARDSGACGLRSSWILRPPVHGHPSWKIAVCLMTTRVDGEAESCTIMASRMHVRLLRRPLWSAWACAPDAGHCFGYDLEYSARGAD